MATGSLDGEVEGINDLQAASRADVRPRRLHARTSRSTYWTFRLMIGFGLLGLAAVARSACGSPAAARTPPGPRWFCRRLGGRAAPALRRQQRSAGSSPRWAASPGPCSACCAPPTASPPASAPPSVLISLIVFTLLYGALAVDRRRADGPLRQGRPAADPSRVRSGRSRTSAAARLRLLRSLAMALHRRLVPAHRRALDRLLRPRGLRLRRRACCCRSSAAPRPTAGSRSTPSARSGTATRCGCWSPAAPPSPRSPSGTRACSPGSTWRCCSSWSR